MNAEVSKRCGDRELTPARKTEHGKHQYDAFDDRQMAELAAYIRARYAPGQPAWRNLAEASARIRQAGAH